MADMVKTYDSRYPPSFNLDKVVVVAVVVVKYMLPFLYYIWRKFLFTPDLDSV